MGTALQVQERYNDDLGNQLAASVAFFGFLSLFPLVLLVLSVAGYVLSDRPDTVRDLADAVARAVPGLGATLEGSIDTLIENRGATGLVGLIGVLFAGLRIVDASEVTISRVFRATDEVNPVVKRARAILHLVVLGSLFLLGTAAASGVSLAGDTTVSWVPDDVGTLIGLLAPVVSILIDTAAFAVAYRLLSAGPGPPWRIVLPGAVLAGILWTVLKAAGAAYAANTVDRWDALYGALGSVIGAMLLLFLAARIFVYGAELAALLRQRAAAEQAPAGAAAIVPEGGPPELGLEERAAGTSRGLLGVGLLVLGIGLVVRATRPRPLL